MGALRKGCGRGARSAMSMTSVDITLQSVPCSAMELWETPFPAPRMPVLAPRAMVATSQPLAAEAGLAMLRNGGNAVDAAVAVAIALTVLEPTSNGIGGDAFAIVRHQGQLFGFNGSGKSPGLLSEAAVLAAAGSTTVPDFGWLPVTVPGAPRLWADLHAKFGLLPFADLFAPAIRYASEGFPVAPLTARGWAAVARRYATSEFPLLETWRSAFLREGTSPAPGEWWRQPEQAQTLAELAATGCSSFYEGALASAIARFAATTGGFLTEQDLAGHHTLEVTPIRGQSPGAAGLIELPPNGQGLVALLALEQLLAWQVDTRDPESPELWHAAIEAIKIAFRCSRDCIADPEHAEPLWLNEDWWISQLTPLPDRASDPGDLRARPGGTVYLCTADADGMMVSMIQSNYMGFGSGLVVPGTGIALQNRGACFDPDPQHPNGVGPGKRPYHTIMPGFFDYSGEVTGPFGIMGGHMQPQAHLQFLLRIRQGYHAQAALDAPRWRWDEQARVAVEQGTPTAIIDALQQHGHEVVLEPRGVGFGRGQAIVSLPTGGYLGASDSRADGQAVGF
ncbi:MAG: Glutathione hydrolase-like YwrD proenzyme [bacterium]|nr:Glutathione hydrolase-like YwrD proenzyme [bacterium]